MQLHTIDTTTVRDLAPLLLDHVGKLQVVPASVLSNTTAQERLVFGVRHGLYGLLTIEMGEFLRQRINGRRAIEFGSGHGALAAWLGIPATDNRQQEEPRFRAHYASLRQPTVPYGEHVEKLDANDAVRKYPHRWSSAVG